MAASARSHWASATDGGAGPGYPHVRAAGTWIMASGLMPALSVEAADGDELLAAAIGQLDDGADLVKLYLDGPDLEASPWSVDELRRVVAAVHARGARVTAHSGYLAGARAGAEAGVDALEHGFELDADVAAAMVRNGVRLVSTLAVMASWETFATTTALPRFASPEGRARTAARRERAVASVGIAHRAGVSIATGTDFGGGSTRANQLGLGGRAAGRGRPVAVGGAGLRDVARGRAAGRARRGHDPRGRSGRLRPGPRRPAVRPRRPVAGVARLVGELTGELDCPVG